MLSKKKKPNSSLFENIQKSLLLYELLNSFSRKDNFRKKNLHISDLEKQFSNQLFFFVISPNFLERSRNSDDFQFKRIIQINIHGVVVFTGQIK